MPKLSAIERARADLSAGRPDLARDRLNGYLYTLHQQAKYDASAYELLGDAYFAMRDYARAGAAWLLTEKNGADVDQAVAAFHKRYGNDSLNMLKAVKPRAPSELYPPAVQARLQSWNYRYQPYRSRAHPRALENVRDGDSTGVRPVEMGCLIAIAAVALIFLFYMWQSFRPR